MLRVHWPLVSQVRRPLVSQVIRHYNVKPADCGSLELASCGSLKPAGCGSFTPAGCGSLKPAGCGSLKPAGCSSLKPAGCGSLMPAGCGSPSPPAVLKSNRRPLQCQACRLWLTSTPKFVPVSWPKVQCSLQTLPKSPVQAPAPERAPVTTFGPRRAIEYETKLQWVTGLQI